MRPFFMADIATRISCSPEIITTGIAGQRLLQCLQQSQAVAISQNDVQKHQVKSSTVGEPLQGVEAVSGDLHRKSLHARSEAPTVAAEAGVVIDDEDVLGLSLASPFP